MLKALLKAIRLPFLILTPVCVLLGAATAFSSGQPVAWSLLPIILVAALSAHISVNALNEYADYCSGLDLNTQRTPFSGGSGALPANPEALQAVLALGIAAFALTVICGIYLAFVSEWILLIAGSIGLALVAFYTPWINQRPWLCLIAPGLGFGTLMVLGTHWVLTGQLTLQAILASIVPFLLVNTLLLLNQFPDLDADRNAGRRHFLIAYGTFAGAITYASGMVICTFVILLGYAFKLWNTWSLITLLPITVAGLIAMAVLRHHQALANRTHILGANVFVTLATPSFLALSLLLA